MDNEEIQLNFCWKNERNRLESNFEKQVNED